MSAIVGFKLRTTLLKGDALSLESLNLLKDVLDGFFLRALWYMMKMLSLWDLNQELHI